MQKLGISKSVPKHPENNRVKPRQAARKMPLIGDAKKDKLKNSVGMSNEEKEKAVTRE